MIDYLIFSPCPLLGENEARILSLPANDSYLSISKIADALGTSTTAVDRNNAKLKEKNLLERIGPPKGGHWLVRRGTNDG